MIEIAILVTLLALSGILSGSESALFSLDPSSLEKLKKSKKHNSKKKYTKIITLTKNSEKTLATLLLFNLAVNTAFTSFGNQFLEENIGKVENFHLYSLAIITLTIVIFGEIFPKVLALSKSLRWSMFIAKPLLSIVEVVSLFTKPIDRAIRFTISFLPNYQAKFDEKEILDSVNQAEQYGVLSHSEKNALMRYVTFHHDTAYSAMIPRSSILMIPYRSGPQKARKYFLEHRQNSQPGTTLTTLALLYKEKDNEIIGYFSSKHLVLALLKKQKLLLNKAKKPIHVPETMPLREVLEAFIQAKSEVAMVLSENGEFLGIITLNHVLQKLIGEFSEKNSNDVVHQEFLLKKISHRGWVIAGAMPINDFNEMFHGGLEGVYAETMSGYIIEQLDGFPQKQTILNKNHFSFSNFVIDKNKIVSFQITLQTPRRLKK